MALLSARRGSSCRHPRSSLHASTWPRGATRTPRSSPPAPPAARRSRCANRSPSAHRSRRRKAPAQARAATAGRRRRARPTTRRPSPPSGSTRHRPPCSWPRTVLPVIDTLELSAIAFPENPHHRLVKGYKLLSDSRNDPVKDARLTLDLLVEEVDALFEMQRADPDWVSLLHFLLRDEVPLATALESVRNASAPSMATAVQSAIGRFDKICSSTRLARFAGLSDVTGGQRGGLNFVASRLLRPVAAGRQRNVGCSTDLADCHVGNAELSCDRCDW